MIKFNIDNKKFYLSDDIILEAFKKEITSRQSEHGNFFFNIRKRVKREIINALENQGLCFNNNQFLKETHSKNKGEVIDLSNESNPFEGAKGYLRYGWGDYSMECLNNERRAFNQLPSLKTFLVNDFFSLGSLGFVLKVSKQAISKVSVSEKTSISGIHYEFGENKIKPYFVLVNYCIKNKIILSLNSIVQKCKCSSPDLDEIRFAISAFPIIFICRICSQLWTCKCFSKKYDIEDNILRVMQRDSDSLRDIIRKIKEREGICHVCTQQVPRLVYGSKMYYSSFLQSFRPYYYLYGIKKYKTYNLNKEESRDIENLLREKFGYPKIGEGWLTETKLFKIISTLLPKFEVIHHYRGKELEGLELDIWVPELKLGIEYQGEQHYKVMEHWGGHEGLKERKLRDAKKREICKKLGFILLEFKYSENLTLELVERKLKKIMK